MVILAPIVPPIVLARVRTQLELKQARDWLRDQNAFLEAEIAKRMAENELIQEVAIRALAHLAETRDPETGNHILRTQEYVRQLALELRTSPRFASLLNDRHILLLTRSAPLHDIGKVGIPDAILLKPGPLTPEEWEIMKTHAQIGAEIIGDDSSDIMRLAALIALTHHEKWDGSGYPQGLAGEAIPLEARIVAIADVFDALTSARPYKAAWSIEAALDYIRSNARAHFDPILVALFLEIVPDILAVRERYLD